MLKPRVTQLVATLLLGSVMVAHVAALPRQESATWELVAPPEEGFSVRMPVKPEEKTDQVPFKGHNYRMRMYTAPDRISGTLFMVIMQECGSAGSAAETSQRFENFMKGFKEGMASTLGTKAAPLEMKADGDLNLKGNPGTQYALSFGSTRGVVRGYQTKDRIYVLVAVGAGAGNEGTKHFFDSFAITPAPVPVPRPVTN